MALNRCDSVCCCCSGLPSLRPSLAHCPDLRRAARVPRHPQPRPMQVSGRPSPGSTQVRPGSVSGGPSRILLARSRPGTRNLAGRAPHRRRAGAEAGRARGALLAANGGPAITTAARIWSRPDLIRVVMNFCCARGAREVLIRVCWRTTQIAVGEPARPHGLVTRITVLAAGFCPAARTARSASRPGFGPAARLSAALGRAHARAPSGGWEGPVLRAGQGCSSAGREILPSQLSEKGPARPAPGRRRRRVTSLRGGGRVLRGLQHERRAAVQGRKPPRCETRVRGRRGDSANPGSENTRLPRRFAKRGRRCGP